MIALYLLAAHLVGDFVLQTRWQAEGKFGRSSRALVLRTRHAVTYCIPFVPIALLNASRSDALLFLVSLYLLHHLADSHRFTSTLGDVIAWRVRPKRPSRRDVTEAWVAVHRAEIAYYGAGRLSAADDLITQARANYDEVKRLHRSFVPDPNPWPPVGLAVDQALHVVQVAVLAGLLL